MKRSAGVMALIQVLIGICISSGAVAQGPPLAPWVNDPRFNAIFDMYWRARLLGSYAGDRVCALPEHTHYDDPQSPFRPIDQRLKSASNRIEIIYPGALNKVARPYRMPPSQSKCDDSSSAYQALFSFETSVTALERLLDNREDIAQQRER